MSQLSVAIQDVEGKFSRNVGGATITHHSHCPKIGWVIVDCPLFWKIPCGHDPEKCVNDCHVKQQQKVS